MASKHRQAKRLAALVASQGQNHTISEPNLKTENGIGNCESPVDDFSSSEESIS